MLTVLNNPIWTALTTANKELNAGTETLAFLDPEIAPFIAMPSWDEKSQKILLEQAPKNRSWFILIAEEVDFIEEFELVSSIPLYQFICPKLISVQRDGNVDKSTPNVEILPLNNTHVDEMVALTALTKPGPFRSRTIEFGNYHGIFKDGKLVAMGGERLHIDGFTEVSAICTHPDYLGKGYAAKIISFLTDSILNKGQTAFLHVRHNNERAIDVYKRLGFQFRSVIQFYVIRKKQPIL
jgi:ribosomal protein S18 acetylase RimI-like enzyme